jgi:hypothetical protein
MIFGRNMMGGTPRVKQNRHEGTPGAGLGSLSQAHGDAAGMRG